MEKYKLLLKVIIEEQNIFRVLPELTEEDKQTANKRLLELSEIKKGYYPFEIESIYEILKPKANENKILKFAEEEYKRKLAKKKIIEQYRQQQNIEYYNKMKKEKLEKEEKEDKFWDFLIMLIIDRQIAVLFYSMEPDFFIQTLLAITKPKQNFNFKMGGTNYEY